VVGGNMSTVLEWKFIERGQWAIGSTVVLNEED
jgi:hypothetical protein